MHATFVSNEEIRKLTTMGPNSVGTNMGMLLFHVESHEFSLTSVDILDTQHGSKRIPDLFIKVQLHPAIPIETRRGVVPEVGFAKTLA